MVFLKPAILDFLTQLQIYEELSGLAGIGGEIESAIQILNTENYGCGSDDLPKLKKVLGPTVFKYVRSVATKKALPALNPYLSNPKVKLYNTLREIWGVGPVAAKTMITKHDVTGLDDVNQKYVLNDAQQLGLKYYADINTPIPRSEAEKIVKVLEDGPRDILVGGSFRRGKSEVKDLDVLIIGVNKPAKYRDYLYFAFAEVEILNFKKNKLTALVKLRGKGQLMRHIDFRYVKRSDTAPALLYFTGNALFNRLVRRRAIQLGFKLNEYGLFDKSANIKIKCGNTEKGILNKLGLIYIEPPDRSFTLASTLTKFKRKK